MYNDPEWEPCVVGYASQHLGGGGRRIRNSCQPWLYTGLKLATWNPASKPRTRHKTKQKSHQGDLTQMWYCLRVSVLSMPFLINTLASLGPFVTLRFTLKRYSKLVSNTWSWLFPRKLLKVRLLKVRYRNSVFLHANGSICFILCLFVFWGRVSLLCSNGCPRTHYKRHGWHWTHRVQCLTPKFLTPKCWD